LSKRRLLVGLGVVAAGVMALLAAGWLSVVSMMGHRTYVVSGEATVSPPALAHVRLPALVCSGHGGPLESSGVYGSPLGSSLERPPQVFCAGTAEPTTLAYEESVYYNKLPRQTHIYVWLESHPELETQCRAAIAPMIAVAHRDLKGHGSEDPMDRPCFAPDRNGSLGYAVAFQTEVPGDREIRQIAVEPRGYR
jgi:hypothetical protein